MRILIILMLSCAPGGALLEFLGGDVPLGAWNP